MRGPPTAEQFTTRQRYRVPGIALPSRRTGATHKPYSPAHHRFLPRRRHRVYSSLFLTRLPSIFPPSVPTFSARLRCLFLFPFFTFSHFFSVFCSCSPSFFSFQFFSFFFVLLFFSSTFFFSFPVPPPPLYFPTSYTLRNDGCGRLGSERSEGWRWDRERDPLAIRLPIRCW